MTDTTPLAVFFRELGVFTYKRQLMVLLLGMLLLGISFIGLYKLRLEPDLAPQDLAPANQKEQQQQFYLLEKFQNDVERVFIHIYPKNENGTLTTIGAYREMIKVANAVKVFEDSNGNKQDDWCKKNNVNPQCVYDFFSMLSYFTKTQDGSQDLNVDTDAELIDIINKGRNSHNDVLKIDTASKFRKTKPEKISWDNERKTYNLEEAQAGQLILYFQQQFLQQDEVIVQEQELRDYLKSIELEFISVGQYSRNMFFITIKESTTDNLVQLVYSCFALICYSLVVMQERIQVTFSGMFTIIVSVVECVLIGVLLSGFPIKEFHQSVGFLMIGIGYDDIQVFETGLKEAEHHSKDPEKVIAQTQATKGVSVTVSSITSFISFSLGVLGDVEAIRSFSFFAGLGILILWINQFLVFGPLLSMYWNLTQVDSSFDEPLYKSTFKKKLSKSMRLSSVALSNKLNAGDVPVKKSLKMSMKGDVVSTNNSGGIFSLFSKAKSYKGKMRNAEQTSKIQKKKDSSEVDRQSKMSECQSDLKPDDDNKEHLTNANLDILTNENKMQDDVNPEIQNKEYKELKSESGSSKNKKKSDAESGKIEKKSSITKLRQDSYMRDKSNESEIKAFSELEKEVTARKEKEDEQASESDNDNLTTLDAKSKHKKPHHAASNIRGEDTDTEMPKTEADLDDVDLNNLKDHILEEDGAAEEDEEDGEDMFTKAMKRREFLKPKQPRHIEQNDSDVLSIFFYWYYKILIESIYAKVIVLLLLVLSFQVAFIGLINVESNSNPEMFIPDGTDAQSDLQRWNALGSPSVEGGFYTFNETLDYSSLVSQQQFLDIGKEMREWRWYYENYYSWQEDLHEFVDEGNCFFQEVKVELVSNLIPQEAFQHCLNILAQFNFQLQTSLIFRSDNTIQNSIVYWSQRWPPVNLTPALMDEAQEIATRGPEGTIAFSTPFVTFQSIERVLINNLLNMISMSSLSIMVIIQVTFNSLHATLIITLAIINILINIFAGIYYLDLYLNFVTLSFLNMSLGMSVDYSAHIIHEYIDAVGTRNERVRTAIIGVGPAIFHAAMSTFIGICSSVLGKGFIWKAFFRLWSSVIVICFIQSTIILPVILSLIGPGVPEVPQEVSHSLEGLHLTDQESEQLEDRMKLDDQIKQVLNMYHQLEIQDNNNDYENYNILKIDIFRIILDFQTERKIILLRSFISYELYGIELNDVNIYKGDSNVYFDLKELQDMQSQGGRPKNRKKQFEHLREKNKVNNNKKD